MGYRLRAVSVKQFCREYTEEQRLATLPQPVDVRVRTVLVPRIAKRVLEAQMPELCEHVARGHTIASALGQLGLIRCGLPGDDWFIDRAYNRPDRQLDAAVRLRRHRYGITWTHGPTIVAQVPDGHRLVAGPYGKLFVRPQRLGDRCKRGHSYEQTGYYLNPNGYRDCKACHNERGRAANQRYRQKHRSSRPHNRDKTACPKGHPYNEENTLVTKQGGRQCRPCRRQRWAEGKTR